jgi:phage terminase large subunit-like protein
VAASSLAERIASLSDADRRAWVGGLSKQEVERLAHDWRFWGRPAQQIPEGLWWLWFIVAGRAWGKNATGANFVHDEADRRPGAVGFIASRTREDAVQVVFGHPRSGLLVTARPWNRLELVHERDVLLGRYANGTKLWVYSSEKPDKARGPEHDFGYGDEFATWMRVADIAGNTLYDNLLMGLRGSRGGPPRALFTSTPRPQTRHHIEQAKKISGELLGDFKGDDAIRVTRGRMLDNAANLPAAYIAAMRAKYEGTRLGRQELEGEILEEVEGAFVTTDMIDETRIDRAQLPELQRIVVGVDPSGGREEQGIIAAGLGVDGHGYVLADRSGAFKPEVWGRRVVELYGALRGDRILAEKNFGGDMVESTIRAVDPLVPVTMVTAARGKHVRFEPVSALYEQKRIHHVGSFPKLEDEVTQFSAAGYEGDKSPNRADALVWAMFDLFRLGEPPLQPTVSGLREVRL